MGAALAGGLVAVSALAQSDYAEPYAFSTLAGTAEMSGSLDGAGAAALFNNPTGVAADGAGNVYVADSGNSTIREISPAGEVTTLAGSALLTGSADGVGAAARFNQAYGVAVDSAGNVYVGDNGNNTIRKMVPTTSGGSTAWTVTTLAGTAGRMGSADGTGAAAEFDLPAGVTVDGAGTLYVADDGNNTVRRITASGVVTTIAGTPGVPGGSADGTGAAARFDFPSSIAVDGSGNLYVGDSGNFTIRRITPTPSAGGTAWVVTTLAGTAGRVGSADGTGAAAEFNYPAGVAVDGAGNVYVADDGNNTVRRISSSGVVTTLAGTAGQAGSADGPGALALFHYPFGVATDPDGNVYVGDTSNCTIRKGSLFSGVYISTQPATQKVNAGSGVVLAVAAEGQSTLTYQWYFNGGAIGGATGAAISLPDVVAGNGGVYTVEVSDGSGGALTSDGATLSIGPPGPSLIAAEPRSQSVNVGSVVVFTVVAAGQPPNATYQWMFNGAALADGGGVTGSTGPQLEVAGAGTANDGDYECVVTEGGIAAVSDSAGLLVVSSPNPGFLVNLSARAFVGTGQNILIGGFFVGGSTSRTILIQALGPALAGEGVSGALEHPALTIHDSTGAVIFANTGWGAGALLQGAAAAVYANPALRPDSADSEVLITLPPGGYTAEIAGGDGGTGVALCAIYQLP